MPMAMGRSKLGPSFFTSAGARLMVVRPKVKLNPELISAVITRSRDSFTAASGKPDDDDDGVPVPGIDFHLDRIRFDAVDGGGTDLGQHGHSYGRGSGKAQCGNAVRHQVGESAEACCGCRAPDCRSARRKAPPPFVAYGVNTPYTTVPELVKGTRTTDSGSNGGESRGPYSERLSQKPLFFLMGSYISAVAGRPDGARINNSFKD